ncbi:MAG: hypothetical protein DHS20C16_20410 [Phycisphaerae bacterium]|nr:MAG: hypothetical protein DHS20C16_20410 [Phycisphaerae bacterium]
MLSRTSEYALRAAVFLAQQPVGEPVPGRRIADELCVPPKYLQNILRELVRVRVLLASPGKGGGFRAARDPKDIRLKEVLSPFESVAASPSRCPFGNAVCSDDDPCAGHDRWKRVKWEYEYFLADTTLHDVSNRRSNIKIRGQK